MLRGIGFVILSVIAILIAGEPYARPASASGSFTVPPVALIRFSLPPNSFALSMQHWMCMAKLAPDQLYPDELLATEVCYVSEAPANAPAPPPPPYNPLARKLVIGTGDGAGRLDFALSSCTMFS